MSTYLVK